MTPVLVLVAADVERGRGHTRGMAEPPEEHVTCADAELVSGVTHRRRPIAAAAALVEQDRPVPSGELVDQFEGIVGGDDAGGDVSHLGSRSGAKARWARTGRT